MDDIASLAGLDLKFFSRMAAVVDYNKTSWFTNFHEYCKFDQFVASIMPALKKLYPEKPAKEWHRAFNSQVPVLGLPARELAIVSSVHKVRNCGRGSRISGKNTQCATATTLRFQINLCLKAQAGAAHIPYLPSKLKPAPAVRYCRRAMGEALQKFSAVTGMVLSPSIIELCRNEINPNVRRKMGKDLFVALIDLRTPQLTVLLGRSVPSLETDGVQTFFSHCEGTNVKPKKEKLGMRKVKPGRPKGFLARILPRLKGFKEAPHLWFL